MIILLDIQFNLYMIAYNNNNVLIQPIQNINHFAVRGGTR